MKAESLYHQRYQFPIEKATYLLTEMNLLKITTISLIVNQLCRPNFHQRLRDSFSTLNCRCATEKLSVGTGKQTLFGRVMRKL